jgi:hypothetical protein
VLLFSIFLVVSNPLVVTTIIGSASSNTAEFKSLKEHLKRHNIYLLSDPEESYPNEAKPSMAAVVAYTKNTSLLKLERISELDKLAEIINHPKSLNLQIKDENFRSAGLHSDSQIILLQLDDSDSNFRFAVPHHFFNLHKCEGTEADEILRIIVSAGERDMSIRSNRPTEDSLRKRFSEAKLAGDDFPSLPNGEKILPGTKIFGNRGFYYDTNGYILEARRIKSTGILNDDWAFLCGFETHGFTDWSEAEGMFEWFSIEELATSLISSLLPPKAIWKEGIPLIRSIDREVMEYCARNPNGFDHLTPDSFEDLIAAIYRNQGFDVEKVGRWNQGDGGVDIFAVRKDVTLGELKLAIQCKHSKNTIQPKVIRELNGTIDHVKATVGVVATTSKFSPNSHNLVENTLWRIRLEDRDKITQRLKEIFGK